MHNQTASSVRRPASIAWRPSPGGHRQASIAWRPSPGVHRLAAGAARVRESIDKK